MSESQNEPTVRWKVILCQAHENDLELEEKRRLASVIIVFQCGPLAYQLVMDEGNDETYDEGMSFLKNLDMTYSMISRNATLGFDTAWSPADEEAVREVDNSIGDGGVGDGGEVGEMSGISDRARSTTSLIHLSVFDESVRCRNACHLPTEILTEALADARRQIHEFYGIVKNDLRDEYRDRSSSDEHGDISGNDRESESDSDSSEEDSEDSSHSSVNDQDLADED